MSEPINDLTGKIRSRVLVLIEQVKRDKSAFHLPEHDRGDQIYARLFDSLQATLHNLNTCEDATEPGGRM